MNNKDADYTTPNTIQNSWMQSSRHCACVVPNNIHRNLDHFFPPNCSKQAQSDL